MALTIHYESLHAPIAQPNQEEFDIELHQGLDKVLELLTEEIFGGEITQEHLKQFIQDFDLTQAQKKLQALLESQKIQNMLLHVKEEEDTPIDLYIAGDKDGLPLRLVIHHASGQKTFDLHEVAKEVDRIRKYKLTYVYNVDNTNDEIFDTVEEIRNALSYQERVQLIRDFNKKWQGELHLTYKTTHDSDMLDHKNKGTYKVTDASGETFYKCSRYPETAPLPVPTPKISTNNNAFFCRAAQYTAVGVGAIATGIYFASSL